MLRSPSEPAVLSTAWARQDQDLKAIFARAHERGAKVMHMVARLDEAERAAEAGADVIVAQGSEGGGHVGEIGTTVIVRQVAKALDPLPVIAAGGFGDGAGLASALTLGAGGVLLGTTFLATEESPVPDYLSRRSWTATATTPSSQRCPIPITGRDWPGAWSRVLRTPMIEEWLGREPELRRRRADIRAELDEAWDNAPPYPGPVWAGQSAGLVDEVLPAGDVVRRIVAEAEEILTAAVSFRIEPATDALFRERAEWRYPPPYDFYNDDGRPPLNPERFYSVHTDDGAIAGFYFFERARRTRSSTASG